MEICRSSARERVGLAQHLAALAHYSGAAALVVVHVDPDRPDDIYRLIPKDDQREQTLAAISDILVVGHGHGRDPTRRSWLVV